MAAGLLSDNNAALRGLLDQRRARRARVAVAAARCRRLGSSPVSSGRRPSSGPDGGSTTALPLS